MIKVGLTGGIGSGKSTVCKVWEQLGAKIIYADDLAKNLMESDPALRKALINAFGQDSYLEDGKLNRPYLAKVAFEKGRVKEFNELIHPRVFEETAVLSKKAEEEGYPMFVKEAALLLQYGRPKDLDYVVVVTADEQKRIQRVEKRDHVDKNSILQRIRKQQSQDELESFADEIIDNNESIESLKEKAEALFYKLISGQR